MELPPIRRIITGHDGSGKAIISADDVLEPLNPHTHQPVPPGEQKAGFTMIYRSTAFPENNQAEISEAPPYPLSDPVSTIVRMVDMPPGYSSIMHRTLSLDFGLVMEGDEVVLELDNGIEVTMKRGEVCVQRGTIHAWHNRSQNSVRFLFVLCPSNKVRTDGGEELDERYIRDQEDTK